LSIEEQALIEDERRRYVRVPSRSQLIRQLRNEAIALRASLRSKLEQARAEPWRGLDGQSPPPMPKGRREERIHRGVNPPE
jgi:hypothetical protein